MIGIIDYGIGNLLAIQNVYNRLNVQAKKISKLDDFDQVTHLILPGVGDFDVAMSLFNNSGLSNKTSDLVLNSQMPILGICVGMQMMATQSEEGSLPGLNWIPGQVSHFQSAWKNKGLSPLPVPHMGWNAVTFKNRNLDLPSFKEYLPETLRYYFLHSYFYTPNSEDHVWIEADYGIKFACAVRNQNIFGVQFHPEKSHRWGTGLLKAFSEVKSA